jgi:hypothetical protein
MNRLLIFKADNVDKKQWIKKSYPNKQTERQTDRQTITATTNGGKASNNTNKLETANNNKKTGKTKSKTEIAPGGW